MKKNLLRLIALMLLCVIAFSYVTACTTPDGNQNKDDGVDGGNDDEDNKQNGENNVKKISILGDSYSTYGGTVPQGNRCFYNGENADEDTESVNDMWWKKLIDYKGYELEVNQSSSGSPVCNTGYHGGDASSHSFIKRMKSIGNPDIIAIFGGTNDAWAKVPLGEHKFSGFTDSDLKTFRPAFAYMLDYLQTEHPDAEIYVIINSGLNASITEDIKAISDYYRIKWILLPDFDKPFGGHPGKDGQNVIFEAVKDFI